MEVKVIEKVGKKATTLSLAWSVNGVRRQERTGLSLLTGSTKEVKELNKKTREKARQMAMEKQLQLQQSIVEGPRPMSLVDYWDMVKDNKVADGTLKWRTVEVWRHSKDYLIRYLQENHQQNILITDVTSMFVEDFKLWLTRQRVTYRQNHQQPLIAKATVNLTLAKLMAVLRFAVSHDVIKHSVLLAKSQVKEADKEVTYLTDDEIALLEDNPYRLKNVWLAARLLMWTGLRISDLKSLRKDEIKDGQIVKIMQKTGKIVTVPVGKKLQAVLDDCDKEYGVDRELVIPDIDHIDLNYHYNQWAKEIGMTRQKLHNHIFRHTFSVRLLTRNVDIYTVSALLGHTNIGTTTRAYSTVTNSMRKVAIDALDK